jgi:hypothetical protein
MSGMALQKAKIRGRCKPRRTSIEDSMKENKHIEFDRRLYLKIAGTQIDAVEAEARRQSERTGYRVTVSDYVRRALMQALERDGQVAA